MFNWLFKKTPKTPPAEIKAEVRPFLRIDFHPTDKGVRHVVIADDNAITKIDSLFKDTDKLYDSQMDERTKIAFFLMDYVTHAIEADRLVKNYMSMVGQPYFVAKFFLNKENDVGVESDYNKHFIYDLDRIYAKNQAPYDPHAEDTSKIAVFLFDTVQNIASSHLPNDEVYEPDDPMRDIPAMSVSGGKEVKQVVDLGRRDPTQTETMIDVAR